ncbi:GNAT family N-acetyltransferase [Halorarius litoreus]|uniref:GNAT family N-acetyltransferase n=1 Tax=Halorarius litoreus TaxID=2962676 RepID=UPI0020CD9D21|nr:GNAT family N-acetyltransferase [Halorarius litoreus]
MYVRLATPDDAQALPDLHSDAVEAFGPGHYTPEQVDRWSSRGERTPEGYPVDEPAQHFTVCVRDGEVAGFGHLAIEAEAVHAVYVHPDHARAGVGSALLAELEGFARGRGVDTLALQSSLNAVGFYEQAGYDRLHESESPGGLPVVEMRKHLA